jgi:hypothetical protein
MPVAASVELSGYRSKSGARSMARAWLFRPSPKERRWSTVMPYLNSRGASFMAHFVKLDDGHIVNADAISCIEHKGGKVLKIHFIGRWDNVLTLKNVDAADVLQRLGAS